jgi:hypothetical protein
MGVTERPVLMDEVTQNLPKRGLHVGWCSAPCNIVEQRQRLVALNGINDPQRVENGRPPLGVSPNVRKRSIDDGGNIF